MNLIKSNVVYDRESHTYLLDGVRLNGITEVIKWQLQPNAYSGIPKEILARAAAKGSRIHDLCEDWDNFGVEVDDYHLADYIRLTEGHTYEVSEYVVTDGKHFASPIDKVFRVSDNEFDIADIKTISKMESSDIEKVTWQTSIYAHWFEQINEGAKVRNLYVIWLPDAKYQTASKQPMMKKLNRISGEEVERLLAAEVNDERYRDNSVPRSMRGGAVQAAEQQMPSEIAAMNDYVIQVMDNFAEAERLKTEMVEKVREAMKAFSITKWQTDGFTFTLTGDTTRRTFDVEKLKALHPEINLEAEGLYKISNVKGSIKLTTK